MEMKVELQSSTEYEFVNNEATQTTSTDFPISTIQDMVQLIPAFLPLGWSLHVLDRGICFAMGFISSADLDFTWRKTVFLELYRIQRPAMAGGYETVMDIYKTTVRKSAGQGVKEGSAFINLHSMKTVGDVLAMLEHSDQVVNNAQFAGPQATPLTSPNSSHQGVDANSVEKTKSTVESRNRSSTGSDSAGDGGEEPLNLQINGADKCSDQADPTPSNLPPKKRPRLSSVGGVKTGTEDSGNADTPVAGAGSSWHAPESLQGYYMSLDGRMISRSASIPPPLNATTTTTTSQTSESGSEDEEIDPVGVESHDTRAVTGPLQTPGCILPPWASRSVSRVVRQSTSLGVVFGKPLAPKPCEASESPPPLEPIKAISKSHAKALRRDPKKIVRPMNMFMLWSKHMREIIRSERPEIHHADLSKILGAKWNALPTEEKQEWQKKAEEHRLEHKKIFPHYKYQPKHSRLPRKKKDYSQSATPYVPIAPNLGQATLVRSPESTGNQIRTSIGAVCVSSGSPFAGNDGASSSFAGKRGGALSVYAGNDDRLHRTSTGVVTPFPTKTLLDEADEEGSDSAGRTSKLLHNLLQQQQQHQLKAETPEKVVIKTEVVVGDDELLFESVSPEKKPATEAEGSSVDSIATTPKKTPVSHVRRRLESESNADASETDEDSNLLIDEGGVDDEKGAEEKSGAAPTKKTSPLKTRRGGSRENSAGSNDGKSPENNSKKDDIPADIPADKESINADETDKTSAEDSKTPSDAANSAGVASSQSDAPEVATSSSSGAEDSNQIVGLRPKSSRRSTSIYKRYDD